MTITISKAQDSDAALIRKLGLETKELQIEEGEPQYYQELVLREFFKSPQDIALVASVDNQFAGYFLVTVNLFLKEAYLIDLVVKKEYRKMGVGDKLLSQVLKILDEKDCRWVWCLVHEDNEKIQKILKQKDFNRGKKFIFYYKDFNR